MRHGSAVRRNFIYAACKRAQFRTLRISTDQRRCVHPRKDSLDEPITSILWITFGVVVVEVCCSDDLTILVIITLQTLDQGISGPNTICLNTRCRRPNGIKSGNDSRRAMLSSAASFDGAFETCEMRSQFVAFTSPSSRRLRQTRWAFSPPSHLRMCDRVLSEEERREKPELFF